MAGPTHILSGFSPRATSNGPPTPLLEGRDGSTEAVIMEEERQVDTVARKTSRTTSAENGKPGKPKATKRTSPGSTASSPKSTGRKKDHGEAATRPVGGSGHSLVIVESPKKARSINKFLGSKYTVKASMGHVRDLPKRKLGLDVAKGYVPSYEVVPNKKET